MAAFKEVFDEALVDALGRGLARGGAFDAVALRRRVLPHLLELELKARVQLLAEALVELLPPFPRSAPQLLAALGQPTDPEGELVPGPDDGSDGLRGFAAWPLTRYVALAGLEHPVVALEALQAITSRFSAEFAVRPYLIHHPELALGFLHQRVEHPDPHVRRWVSEGTRPRLPWGEQLRAFVADPTPNLALVEHLRDDPSLYVRRSVANHLGDVAKDHPERMLEVCERWAHGASPERSWLIRHACRGPLKAGHPRALRLLGYAVPAAVELLGFEVEHPRLLVGEVQVLRAELRSIGAEPQRLMVDHVAHLVGARTTREKVWKGRQLTLGPGESVQLTLQQGYKPVSTRRYYPGTHRVELAVNGQRLGHASFELITP